MKPMEMDRDPDESAPPRRFSSRLRKQVKKPDYREPSGELSRDDAEDDVFKTAKKGSKQMRGSPVGEDEAMDVDKAVDLTEGRTPEEVEDLVKEILKKLCKKKGLDHLNDPNHFNEDKEGKGTFDYSVYIMIDKEDEGVYIGTKAGRTDSPCVVWSRREDDFYYRNHDETAPFTYKCSIVYKGNRDPYSSMAAAESRGTYARILQQVAHEIRPDIYKPNKNIKQRLTGMVWSKDELVQKLHKDISNGIQVQHAIPPVNPFYKDMQPEFSSKPPKKTKLKKVSISQIQEIVENLLQRKQRYATSDAEAEKKREEIEKNVEGEIQNIPLEEFLSRLSLKEYDEVDDIEHLETIFQTKLQLEECAKPEIQQVLSEPDEEGIDPDDPSYYSVYIMQNIETGAIYIGSKAGKTGRPCVIWKKVEGTRMYIFHSAYPGQLFVHIASFIWTTTSINYHEVVSAADSHAAYLQLLQTICHELNPRQYGPLVNQFLKVKPLVWTTEQLSKHLVEDLINGRTALDAMIPVHPFICAETRIESVLAKSVFQPATLEDIEDGIADVKDKLPLSVAASIHGLPVDMLLAVLKLKNQTGTISTGVTMSEVTGALSLIQENVRRDILTTCSTVELHYPLVPKSIIQRYAAHPSKISRIDQRRFIVTLPKICYFCKNPYTSLVRHMRTHTKEKPFFCRYEGCGRAFADSAKLQDHMRTHTGEKPYVCKIEGCGRAFADWSTFYRHKRTHTGEKPFLCKFEGCSKAFADSSTFSRHKRTHTGEKPYVCKFEGCGKAFTNPLTLKVHKRTHTGEKPYVCKIEGCGKAFGHSSTFSRHKRTHTEEKPFLCKFEGCSKAFGHSSNLSQHMLTHNKEKKYVCSFKGCGKAFGTQSNLSTHKQTHNKQKKYLCTFEGCSKAYKTSKILSKHKQTHHKDKKYACSFKGCGKVLYSSKSLSNHKLICRRRK